MAKKTERVTIRFPERDYEFLQDVAKELDIPLARLIRRICIRFWMKYVLGDVQDSFTEVHEEFMRKVSEYIEEGRD